MHDVAIIGGGFSGLLVLHHLVKNANASLSCVIFEPRAELGMGIAYSTPHPWHLLNVPAGKMSAIDGAPDHFTRWLDSEHAGKWSEKDYVPRMVYMQYLKSIAAETLAMAKKKGVGIEHIRTPVDDCRQTQDSYTINERFQARKILLALGNLEGEMAPRAVQDIWNFDYAGLKNKSGPVVIIGTGLTMVDTLLSIRKSGFDGDVHAFSRHGLLPHVHDDTSAAYASVAAELAKQPQNLRVLMRTFRKETEECARKNISWQVVIGEWRPHIPALWSGLSVRDRQRFMRSIFTVWNVHRHRMAAEIGHFVDDELKRGKLTITTGDAFADGRLQNAETVFDCRGPGYNIRKSANPLLKNLLANRLVEVHRTGWGIAMDKNFHVISTARENSFYTMGALALGARLETVAVPELRAQARMVARSLLC